MNENEINIDPYRELSELEILSEMVSIWKAENLWPCCLCLKVPKFSNREFTWQQKIGRFFSNDTTEYIHIDCNCANTWIHDYKSVPRTESVKDMWNVMHRPKVEEAVEIMKEHGFEIGARIYHTQGDNRYKLYDIRHSTHFQWKPFARSGCRCNRMSMAAYL